MKEVKVVTEGKYHTHSVRANKALDITFKAPYTMLANYIQTIQMLNEDVELVVKIGSDKPIKIGTFMIRNLNVDGDGEGTLKLTSQLDFIDANKINELASRNTEPLKIMLKCKIVLEGEDEEESA